MQLIKPDLAAFRTYFFDLDGTLYLGNKIIPGADKLITKLNKMDKHVYAITNNCILHVEEYWRKLQGMGIDIKRDHVINSTTTVINWLKQNQKLGKKVYVHGTPSMVRQMREAKVQLVESVQDAELLVLGNDRSGGTWQSLTDFAVQVQRDIPYLVANADLRLPLGGGMYGVDTGSTAVLIEAVAQIKPLAVLGKTFPGFLQPYITGASIFFGDRIYTDMACAKAASIANCLVFSGEATVEDYHQSTVSIDHTINSVADLI